MTANIVWHPPVIPEERKKIQWEHIIRFELGEVPERLEVSLTYAEERLRWQLDAGAEPLAAACKARLVAALRATGKPVE
jgi:hypothetical protein